MHSKASTNARRCALLGTLALVVTTMSACATEDHGETGDSSEELTTLRVALNWIPNVEFAGFWIAEERGYYADEGLEIEWIPGGPNTTPPDATLAAGAADIGIATAMTNLVPSIEDGNDFVVFGSIYQDSPSGLLSLASNPIETAEDVVGSTIIGGEAGRLRIDTLLQANDLPLEYDYIPVGTDLTPLVDGVGDALVAYATNQPIILEHEFGMTEDDYVFVTQTELGVPSYGLLMFSQRAFADASPEAIEGFLRASSRGWQENEDDVEVGARLAVDDFGAELALDLAQQIRENELQIPFVVSDLTDERGLFYIDIDLFGGPMYRAMQTGGQLSDAPPAAESIVDLSFLDAVYADGIDLTE